VKYYVEAWKRYTDFKGRSSRPAYWWPFLATPIIVLLLGGVSASVLGTASDEMGPLESIYILAWLCPSIALYVRRLHDIGRSGWWSLIALTGVGVIVLIVWACRPGEDKANAWGPPLGDPSHSQSGSDPGAYNHGKASPEGPIIS